MKITIPIKPLSYNGVLKRSKQGRMFLTPEGKAYKEELGWAFKSTGVMYLGPVCVDLEFVMKDMRTDPANCIKMVLDAMQGHVLKNDRQVRELTMKSTIDKLNPSITVTVREL